MQNRNSALLILAISLTLGACTQQTSSSGPGNSAKGDESAGFETIQPGEALVTEAGSELVDENLCEAMSFNPGHAPKEHRGLGSVQRARTLIYAAIESARNHQMSDN